MDAPEALNCMLTHDRGPVLVAELDGRVVGTALGSWDGRWAWVTRLAVHPDFRRRGVAKLLMAEVERRLAALGAGFAALLVGTANAGALALYESLGYRRRDDVAFIVKRFGDGEEACCGPQSG
jgi:ribosomal protein S18 acetylase RimI-like enzyme